jgi:hypothetical protein
MTDKKKKSRARKRLGEMLIEAGLVDEMQLAVALGQQKQWGGKLGSELVRLGFIAERELALILQEQMGIKWISLFDREIPPEAVKAVPYKYAIKYLVMPLDYDGKTITLATTNPTDLNTMDTLTFILGKRIEPVMALESDINRAIARHYRRGGENAEKETAKALEAAPDFNGEPWGEEKPSRAVAREILSGNAFLQEALINLLLEKKLISRKELLEELKKLKD